MRVRRSVDAEVRLRIDLLLDLDDDLMTLIHLRACAAGMSPEEFLRATLMEGTGRAYMPLPDGIVDGERPIVRLDLRRP